jgi:hypothetical protein
MGTIGAKIRPMEQSGARFQNVQDRFKSPYDLPVAARKYWPQLLIIIFGLGLASALFVLQRAPVGGRNIVKITGVDAVYYFATAHSLLFDRDYDLTNEFQFLEPHQIFRTQVRPASTKPENPFAIGYPILSTPFLAAGTAVDAFAGRPADGYSQSALFFYFLANIAFVVLGMIFLSRLLQHVGLSSLQAIFIAFSLWCGTTLGYYTLSPMSHSATFMMASAFMLVWWRVKDSSIPGAWALLGFCGGFLSICRWQDIFYLGIPVLFELSRSRTLVPWRRWFMYGGAAAVCWVPQIAEWKVIYGRFFTIPQGPDFLHFPPHYMHLVLFSTNHGWFIWTPITALGVLGLFYGARKATAFYWPCILVIFLEVAVMGSMPTNWHNSESFGIRSLTSCVPLIGLGVATLMRDLGPRFKAVVVGLVAACAIYTTLFAVQYRLDLVPKIGTLTTSELLGDKLSLKQAYRRTHRPPDSVQPTR